MPPKKRPKRSAAAASGVARDDEVVDDIDDAKSNSVSNSSSSSTGSSPASSCSVPAQVWKKMWRRVQETLKDYSPQTDSRSEASSNAVDTVAECLKDRLQTWLPHLDTKAIVACFEKVKTNEKTTKQSRSKTATNPTVQTTSKLALATISHVETALATLLTRSYEQTMRAHDVFDLLDVDGKGCVVVEDLQRAALELIDATAAGGSDGNVVDEQDLNEMMQLLNDDTTTSSGGHDGGDDGMTMLSRNDLVRIARLVNL